MELRQSRDSHLLKKDQANKYEILPPRDQNHQQRSPGRPTMPPPPPRRKLPVAKETSGMMKAAMTKQWSTERPTKEQLTPNELLYKMGKKTENKRGIASEGIVVSGSVTKGGENLQMRWCWMLAIIAALSSVMPSNIKWTKFEKFWFLIYDARRSTLKDWHPEATARGFFKYDMDDPPTQQDPSTALLHILADRADAKSSEKDFLDKFTTKMTISHKCGTCASKRTELTYNRTISCELTGHSLSLHDALEQKGEAPCAQCGSRHATTRHFITKTSGILVVEYKRRMTDEWRNTFRAPTELREEITVSGRKQTATLRGVVVHSPTGTILPDESDNSLLPEASLIDHGHYLYMEVESDNTTIIHNDALLRRASVRCCDERVAA